MNLFKMKSILLFSLIFTVVVSSSYIFISTVHELQFTNSEYFKDQALSYRIKSNKLKVYVTSSKTNNNKVYKINNKIYKINNKVYKINNKVYIINKINNWIRFNSLKSLR